MDFEPLTESQIEVQPAENEAEFDDVILTESQPRKRGFFARFGSSSSKPATATTTSSAFTFFGGRRRNTGTHESEMRRIEQMQQDGQEMS